MSNSSRFIKETPWWAIETTPDPDLRVYHTRIRLLSDDKFALAMMQGAQSQCEVEPIVDILLSIRGVIAVEVRANFFCVRRTPMFTWDEIEDKILDLLYGVQVAEQIDIATAEGFAIIQATKPKPRQPRRPRRPKLSLGWIMPKKEDENQ